jgi:hypothetical protein
MTLYSLTPAGSVILISPADEIDCPTVIPSVSVRPTFTWMVEGNVDTPDKYKLEIYGKWTYVSEWPPTPLGYSTQSTFPPTDYYNEVWVEHPADTYTFEDRLHFCICPGYITYYWRVIAYFGEYTIESDFFSFRPIDRPHLAALLAPENESTGTSTTPTLSWRYYELPYTMSSRILVSLTYDDIANPFGQMNPIIDIVVPYSAGQYTISDSLSYNTQYFWRVINSNECCSYPAPYWDFGYGVRSFTTMHDTSIDDETMVGYENRLQQNYPNPFNPSTLISFSISQTDYVKLQVYNVKGQLVKTLISDILDAGRHSITWHGDNDKGSAVSSGIYFYRLECSSHSQTKKMLLMK